MAPLLPIEEDISNLLGAFPSLDYIAAEAEILRRRRSHNALSTIHRLPSELLTVIFVQATLVEEAKDSLITTSKTQYLHKLWSLAQVSSTWRDIVKSSSELWNRVDFRNSLEGWRAPLARSGTTPITVVLPKAADLPTDQDQKARKRFWDDVSRHIPRWQTVALCLSGR